ncbi:hypothetical protein [Pelagibius marinus]|uniref:hypothetical protein n=1 Tax=Pelagibius marinus TaxID=2762760 RepID=UPI00187296D2|nr:hypothetical protein [Pelagibius marinus]
MGKHVYELKGRAKTWAAVTVFVILAWTFFGQSFFNFNLGFFNRGYQVASLRSGHFERHGIHWQQHDVTVGHVVSLGGETATLDLDAEINRGILVVHAWRWPAFFYDEPTVYRLRLEKDAQQRTRFPLEGAGIYVLSVNGIYFGGDLSLDWRTGEDG